MIFDQHQERILKKKSGIFKKKNQKIRQNIKLGIIITLWNLPYFSVFHYAVAFLQESEVEIKIQNLL